MKTDLILVFTSPDRTGVVELLTSTVVEHGGNWEESRLARLCGDFAGIVRVSVPTPSAKTLSSALESLSEHGLQVHVKPARKEAATEVCRVAELECNGADHEGIANSITQFLAGQNVSVEEMETSVAPAPTTGTPVFMMSCSIAIPESVDTSELTRSLAGLERELAMDIKLDGQDVT